ncbi:MAG: ABC transporter permease, partial [Chloroflexota bacterium]
MTTQPQTARVATLKPPVDPEGREFPERPSIWQRLLGDARAVVGISVLLVITVGTLLAPYIAPHDPQSMAFDILQPPSATHWMGTDDLGRDLFTRVLYGARISLFVGVVTVAISLVVGVGMGLLAGYYGGWIDTILMRYIDIQWAFPNFIVAVYLVAVFGTGLSNVIVAVALAFLD